MAISKKISLTMPTTNKEKFNTFLRSVRFFPALLVLLLIILTAGKISGTSVGVYHSLLYGTEKDSSLLMGEPRPIRSDEWGVVTPAVVSQTKENFPTINKTIGDGQDMAVTIDVPYKEWSTAFKPQNWAFFVLPIEYAFAFKWWLMAVLLMLACYFFTLTLLPRKYLVAALLSLCLFYNPFVQWWYQSITLLSLAYGLFAAGLAIRLLRDELTNRSRLLLAATLWYILSCAALLLYLPFIVPIALVLAAFLAGHMCNVWLTAPDKKVVLRRSLWIVVPALIASIIFIGFLYSHRAAIETVGNTVYPGQRIEKSGHMDIKQLLGGYYNLQLEDTAKAIHYGFNQSEASNFMLLLPFLMPYLVFVLVQAKRTQKTLDWRIVGLLGIITLFLLRLFIPASEFLFNILQLNRIPHNRLLIGLGLANLLALVISLQHLQASSVQIPRLLRRVSNYLTFIVVCTVGIGLKVNYDGYLESPFKILAISLLFTVIIWLLLRKRYIVALSVLLVFSFLSVNQVNPLYQGLGMLTDSKLTNTIRSIGDEKGAWIVGDYAASFEEFPMAAGVRSISGVYAYPQLQVWDGIAKDQASQNVYNRYAHVFFSVESTAQNSQGQGSYFDPPALDAFRVHSFACSSFLKEQSVRYILVTTDLHTTCTKQIKQISYPKVTFRVYEISR